MKKVHLFSLLVLITTIQLQAQSTALRVYDILQEKCVSCHSNGSPAAALDLEGSGETTEAKLADVYQRMLNATPDNDYAANKGYKYIYPGRADKSFLFRKINDGLEPLIQLNEAEATSNDVHGSADLNISDVEKEMIRQWISYAAPATGTVVSESLIENYYNNNGVASFPDGPPAAPDASEGFQIKMGPFYLEPGGQAGSELEYFQKYELELPENVEVTRIEMAISDYSHHLIIYNFGPGGDNNIPAGFRLEPDHSDISLVAAVQEATDLKLPEGTAFKWDNDIVLDLNSHYINYSATSTYQAEAYINIYTQPIGTAVQEMQTELIVKGWIPIPNNGDMITHTQHVNPNWGELFIWGLMGHTHKYGQGYQVYKRGFGGSEEELVYDASCPQGLPDCASPFYDYRHIPFTLYEPLMPITFSSSKGIIHKANYINDGPTAVNFGPTSDDEMMVLVMMFTTDTTGLTTTGTHQIDQPFGTIEVFPNPMQDKTTIQLPTDLGTINFQLYDAMGRVVKTISGIRETQIELFRADLAKGMYMFRIEDEKGRFQSGKILMN